MEVEDRGVVELGSGTGVVGLAAASLGTTSWEYWSSGSSCC